MEVDPYQSPRSKSQFPQGGSISGLILFERAVRELTQHWKVILAASMVPLICSSLIQVARLAYIESLARDLDNIGRLTAVSLGLFWISIPFYVLFATNCHRVILLGEDSLANRFGLYWSSNETRFLGWVIVLGIIGGLASIPTHFLPAILVSVELHDFPAWLFTYLGVLISTYLDGRLGLVLPATAIGKRMKLSESWRRSGRVGWAIFFALIIPIAIAEIIDYVLFSQLTASHSMVVYLFRMILFYPLIAIGVSVLTIAYRDLE